MVFHTLDSRTIYQIIRAARTLADAETVGEIDRAMRDNEMMIAYGIAIEVLAEESAGSTVPHNFKDGIREKEAPNTFTKG